MKILPEFADENSEEYILGLELVFKAALDDGLEALDALLPRARIFSPFLTSPKRNREYNFGACLSSIAILLSVAARRVTLSKISWCCWTSKNAENFGLRSCSVYSECVKSARIGKSYFEQKCGCESSKDIVRLRAKAHVLC
jgi:hypothetical protein